MKRLMKQKRGQFVIIAVLMIAIMVISIGALMHRAVTYYKHEPWEEYLTLTGNIELSARRIVELSLVNFTNSQSPNPNILKENMEKWQMDLARIYPGYGISVTCNDHTITCVWNKTESFSTANATFTLDINSIGLFGYKFASTTALKIANASKLTFITVMDKNKPPRARAPRYIWTVNLTVIDEKNNPITSLGKENFIISGLNYTDFTVCRSICQEYGIIYAIKCEVPEQPQENQMIITVCDARGIKVTGKFYGAPGQTVETKSPTYTTGSWSNPTNAYEDGSGFASTKTNGATQSYSGYGFDIPNGSQIVSVKVGLDVWTEDNEKILLHVSTNGGIGWLTTSGSIDNLPKTEATFWMDITGWTDWSTDKVNEDMIWMRVTHQKVGKTSQIYLDWIRVEITYIPP